ncbi:MAG: GNAT family N-acetyltransferase [Solirubrobacterales bacterium]|nr:GNAT family N-acetyltransferase [Solirubrobacterales bacterium]
MDLLSPRLRLALRTPADIRDLLDGRGGATPWASGYPLDGTLVAAAMQAELHERGIDPGPFGQYRVIRREDDVVIGDIGFHQPPDELGEVSVGFGIVPEARGRGYATEALRTLLEWALRHPDVRAVHADTDLVNLASQRVLVKAGMVLVADEGDRKVYEILGERA